MGSEECRGWHQIGSACDICGRVAVPARFYEQGEKGRELGVLPDRLSDITEVEIEGVLERTMSGPDRLNNILGIAGELGRLEKSLKFYFLEKFGLIYKMRW